MVARELRLLKVPVPPDDHAVVPRLELMVAVEMDTVFWEEQIH